MIENVDPNPATHFPHSLTEGAMETLDMSNQTLTSTTIRDTAKALESNRLLRHIKLSDCLIGDDGCIVICNALKSNDELDVRRLDLNGNNLRADGCLALGQLLKVNSSIQVLSLEWNCVGIWENGIKALADSLTINQTLQELDLRNNKIGPQAAQYLAIALKHNTSLQRLDLRWNAIGLTGAKALLDTFKWNFTITSLDLTGNEVSDDILHSIEMAVERNRLRALDERKQSEQSRLLSSTLQTISKEHEDNLSSLKSKLFETESQSKQMADKLRMASEEMETSHSSYQILQTKLLEERTIRERIEARFKEMEETLLRERKEHTERCQTLLNELMTERAIQPQREESHRVAINEITARCLDAESRLKDADYRVERASRDKNNSELELERTRAQLHQIQRANEEQVQQLHRDFSNRLNETVKEHQLELQRVRKGIQSSNAESEATVLALRKTIEQLREQQTESEAAKGKIRTEEAAKRQDIVNRLQQTLQHRDHLQNLLQQAQQSRTEIESRLQPLQSSNDTLKSSNATLQADVERLEAKQRELYHAKQSVERELERLKADNERLQDAADRLKHDEMARAKALERAIVGYVRTVEKSSMEALN